MRPGIITINSLVRDLPPIVYFHLTKVLTRSDYRLMLFLKTLMKKIIEDYSECYCFRKAVIKVQKSESMKMVIPIDGRERFR